VDSRDLVAAIEAVVRREPRRSLAIYLHVPFCASKCHFCDWVVDVPVARLRSTEDDRRGYVDALCRQIRYYGPLLTGLGYRPAVMYWGGGTPTRLNPSEMRAIAAAIDDGFDRSELVQWSMETTPNDLTADKLVAMRELGVNRVSVGAQSFNPEQLRRSGRAHTAEQTEQAVALLRAHGIDNFNLDLISSFPGEALESFRATMDRALALDPPHLSIYPYRATPKTVMAMQLERSVVAAQTRQRMVNAYELAMAMLRDAGYHEYCHGYWVRRAEHEDQDGNYKYDLAGDKIGFGSGAESIIGHHLLWNENHRYRDFLADPLRFSYARPFSLDEPDRLTAPVGGALMTREGVDYARFARLTGLSFQELRETDYMRQWLAVLAECGARYLETDTAFRLDPAVIHETYITHLAYTMSAGLEPLRA